MLSFQGGDKTLRCSPGTEGMATGRANTDLEHIEYGNGFVWQEIDFVKGKLKKNYILFAFYCTFWYSLR